MKNIWLSKTKRIKFKILLKDSQILTSHIDYLNSLKRLSAPENSRCFLISDDFSLWFQKYEISISDITLNDYKIFNSVRGMMI